jgi:hypothetical protein
MKEFILFEFKFTTVAVSLIKKFKFKKEEIKRKFLKNMRHSFFFLGKKQPEFWTKDFKYFKVNSNCKIKYIVVAIITNYLT